MTTQCTWNVTTMLALTGGACALWWYLNKRQRTSEDPDSILKAGSLKEIIKGKRNFLPDVLNCLAKTYGNIYEVKVELGQVVVVNSRELIELVGIARAVGLLCEHPKVTSRVQEAHAIMYPKEKCCSLTDQLKGQCQRVIRCYGREDHLLGANVLVEVDKLIEVFRLHESSETQFDVFNYVHFACINVLCSLMFGCRYKYKSQRLKTFAKIIHSNLSSKNIFKFCESCKRKPPKACLERQECCPAIENLEEFLCFIDYEVESHRKDFDSLIYRDFIDIYLKSLCVETENRSPISRLSLDSTIVDVFTFGAEQVAAHITWALYCMVEYPDVQSKCHDEIDEKVGHCRPVTLEDRKNLTYVCSTLKEVMRRFTIVPLSLPLVAKDTIKLGPYVICENTTIVCNYHSVHMNPRVWENPDTFCPERFRTFVEDHNCKSFFNFGASGPHPSCPAACLSSKITFIIFANLLQKFDFKGHSSPCYRDDKMVYDIVRCPPSFKVKIDSH